jgi:hypothetical protein
MSTTESKPKSNHHDLIERALEAAHKAKNEAASWKAWRATVNRAFDELEQQHGVR